MAKRYELTNAQWERIAALLPGKAGDPRRTAADNRLFVNGVLWVLRSGAHWHDLPVGMANGRASIAASRAGPTKGVWERVFKALIDDPTTNISCSTPPWFAPTSRQRPGKGGPEPGSGAFPRRTDHQDPHARRCARPATALHPHRRAGA